MSRVFKATRTFKPTINQEQSSSQPTTPECTNTAPISPAEKMKQKAMAAKAARSAEKQRNQNLLRRSTSLLNDVSSTPTFNTQQPLIVSPSQQQDISTLPTKQPWSPPIDPQLHMPAFLDQHTNDIPVPNITESSSNTLPPPTLSAQTLPALTNTQAQPTNNPKQSTTAKSNPPIKKNVTIRIIQSNDDEEEEDISPRLKRKRHLEQLRMNKKNKTNNANRDTQAADDGIEKTNKKLAARFKRRLENNGTSSQRMGKKAKRATKKLNGINVTDQNGNQTQATGEGDQEGSDSDDDAPLDPTKVSMASLTNPYRCKGKASEVLEKRRLLIIERQEREKQERAATRANNIRQAKLVLLNRAKSIKARRRQQQFADQAESQDLNAEDEALEQVLEEEEHERYDPGHLQQDNVNETEARKKKIMEEYGLEDVDSDDDLVDFEEVEYDEFAKNNNKKTASAAATTSKKKSVTVPDQNDEQEAEEEDEVIEENFNVDDYVPQASQYAPQLRLVNGQMVLDQDSLEVDRRDHSPQLDDMEVVEESDTTRLVNSNTWSKAVRGERWTAEETCLFYDAVRLFGSDFEMISQLFPGRTRRQIRLKWNKEEKRSPEEITQALLGKKRGGETEELGRISEQTEDSTTSGEEGEGEGELVEGSVEMPSQLHGFRQYAKIVGIDCTGPIPADPMDKWREKERLEYEQQRRLLANQSASKAQNSAQDDDDHQSLVEDEFAGWGELDDD